MPTITRISMIFRKKKGGELNLRKCTFFSSIELMIDGEIVRDFSIN